MRSSSTQPSPTVRRQQTATTATTTATATTSTSPAAVPPPVVAHDHIAETITTSSKPAPGRRQHGVAGSTVAHHTGFRRVDAQGLAMGRATAFVDATNAALGLTGAALLDKQQVMRTDPHTFFRAMPALFVNDVTGPFHAALAITDQPAPERAILADFHLGNLGTFRGPKGVVWGPNDYDQAGTGRPELDLLRGVSSIALMLHQRGSSPKTTHHAIATFVDAYATELERLADGKKNPGPVLKKSERHGAIEALTTEASARKEHALLKRHVDGKRLRRSDDLVDISPAQYRAVARGLAAAVPGLDVIDIVAKHHAGGSSRGLPRFWALVGDGEGAKRILEIKQPPPSPLGTGAHFDVTTMLDAQRALMGDVMSPWTKPCVVGGSDFLLREVEVEKGTLDLGTLKMRELDDVAGAAGTVLARLHGADAKGARQMAAWMVPEQKRATKNLQAFADAYSAHVVGQHAAFCAAHPGPSAQTGW